MLCCAINAHSQAKTFDKLTQRMINAFEKTDTGGLYRALGLAAVTAFDPRSTAFLDVWKPIEQQYPEASKLDIMSKITDSVMTYFYEDYLEKKLEKDFDKYRDIMGIDFTGMCPCVTPRVKNGYTGQDIGGILKRCEDSLLKDKAYMKKFDEAAKKNPGASKEKRFGSLMTKHLLLKCYDFYEHSIDYILHVNMEQYLNLEKIVAPYMYKRPTVFYQQKKMDSLAAFFPDYKKYEADIKKIIALGNPGPGYIIMEGPVKASDTQGSKMLLLFTLKNAAIIINGQLSFTYTKTMPLKMLSYTFTPADKLKDQDLLMEKIEREIDDSFTSYYKND